MEFAIAVGAIGLTGYILYKEVPALMSSKTTQQTQNPRKDYKLGDPAHITETGSTFLGIEIDPTTGLRKRTWSDINGQLYSTWDVGQEDSSTRSAYKNTE